MTPLPWVKYEVQGGVHISTQKYLLGEKFKELHRYNFVTLLCKHSNFTIYDIIMQTTTIKEIFCYNPPPPTHTPFPLIFFTFPEFRGLYKQKLKRD